MGLIGVVIMFLGNGIDHFDQRAETVDIAAPGHNSAPEIAALPDMETASGTEACKIAALPECLAAIGFPIRFRTEPLGKNEGVARTSRHTAVTGKNPLRPGKIIVRPGG